DVTATGLTRCSLVLLGVMDALRLQGLTDCRVFCGPVRGPVYVDGCHCCCIAAASRQLRIHETASTDFYVRTLSGPIIEDCSKLRFAPYRLDYAGLATDLDAAGLAATAAGTGSAAVAAAAAPAPTAPGTAALPLMDAWKDIKDFRWLRTQQSPHWSIMPE
ncbi:unnamed protein product, partial [Phaeothamnion confervicola]